MGKSPTERAEEHSIKADFWRCRAVSLRAEMGDGNPPATTREILGGYAIILIFVVLIGVIVWLV